MNKENYLEIVRQQYTDEIYAAFQDHEHRNTQGVDLPGLNRRLQSLMTSAQLEGLSFSEFEDLARTTLPVDVAHRVDLGSASIRKKAA